MQQRGLPVGAPPDPWNIERPDTVAEVARAYVASGSRAILTNTFGATRVALMRHGLAGRAAEINRAGAEISRLAAEGRARVFGSVGPTGKLPSMGEIEESELSGAFHEQIGGLVDGGVDGIVVETMSDLVEACAATRCAAETGLPVVACMTFGAGKAGDRTIMGSTPEQVAGALLAAGADLIGSNCGQGAAAMSGVVARLHAAGGRPVWAKPNAGLPSMTDGVAVYSQTPEDFVEEACGLLRAGAGFLGGCCGTSPEFVRLLAVRVAAGSR
jgi:methionine synthase I (cobalamin-dependent)